MYTVTAITVGNKIYLIGGGYSDGPKSSVYEFDPVAETWKTKTPMDAARSGVGLTTKDGLIYVVGGSEQGVGNTGRVDVYNPAADR